MCSALLVEWDDADGQSEPSTRLELELADARFTILAESDHDTHVLKIAGELDRARAALMARRCVEGQAPVVVVDLTDLTFLDCGGYRAFVAARAELEQQRRTLVLVGAVGEPRRLLDRIRQFDRSRPSSHGSGITD